MWYYRFDICVNNCSLHGDCKNGFCFCYVGYYGVDCSNTSCPGTACYYDDTTHEQVITLLWGTMQSVMWCDLILSYLILFDVYPCIRCVCFLACLLMWQVCRHACQSAYNHTDDDVYIRDMRKVTANAHTNIYMHLLAMLPLCCILHYPSLACSLLVSQTIRSRRLAPRNFQGKAMECVMVSETPFVLHRLSVSGSSCVHRRANQKCYIQCLSCLSCFAYTSFMWVHLTLFFCAVRNVM